MTREPRSSGKIRRYLAARVSVLARSQTGPSARPTHRASSRRGNPSRCSCPSDSPSGIQSRLLTGTTFLLGQFPAHRRPRVSNRDRHSDRQQFECHRLMFLTGSPARQRLIGGASKVRAAHSCHFATLRPAPFAQNDQAARPSGSVVMMISHTTPRCSRNEKPLDS